MNLIEQGDILMGFRPETFLPAECVQGGEGSVTYPFEVTYLEYLGAERLVYGNIGEKSHARHVVSRLPGNLNMAIEAGSRYSFAVSKRDLRYFDRTSGLRVERGAT
jgi:multiple sugar transport system ATP-binding protein